GFARYREFKCLYEAPICFSRETRWYREALSSLCRNWAFCLPQGIAMPSMNNTNRFYDAIADHYTLFFRDWETAMEREGLGLRSIFRNKGVTRVLDASSGAGAQAIPLAQLGFEVVAADPSTGMLRKA